MSGSGHIIQMIKSFRQNMNMLKYRRESYRAKLDKLRRNYSTKKTLRDDLKKYTENQKVQLREMIRSKMRHDTRIRIMKTIITLFLMAWLFWLIIN